MNPTLRRGRTSVAMELTRWRSRRPNQSLLLVSEYPKAGGTWLARMLSSYLDWELPQSPTRAVRGPAVVHNHWPYDAGFPNPTVYVMRDGRDVMVSLLFHRLREDPAGRDARAVSSAPNRDEGVRQHLPSFIEREAHDPRPRTMRRRSWSRHVREWSNAPGSSRVVTSYESLSADTTAELSRVLTALEIDVDHERVGQVVEGESFERVSGRSPGTADPSSFLRKGIVGDWRNYFTEEASRTFESCHPGALTEFGYEDSEAWLAGGGG